ncbi:NIMA-interacting protein tinc [Xylaria nigripes]|nr:NIMA-interacting protein tinc [Xylaria nigripes]
MISSRLYPSLLGLAVLLIFARPALAFGAGNIAGISKVEGQNWRHGDIEDTLLTLLMARAVGGKKFSKLMVSRVYFGNWLRDYSQAIDVATVKSVSAEAIRLLLCVLGFMSFGFGSKEFEVTADRLGCYRPEDHIDNPKNYANNEDASRYYNKLRGPVDESVELAIDEETGMKNYIANERVNIMTSALHVRRLFSESIKLVRNYQHNPIKADFFEALRLMGTGLHCLEDFLAHSNYTELALIEMGENDVFPHVGRRTQIQIPGVEHEVWPVTTGTFGGVDFLHSVTGEVSDKLTQNEIQQLEGTLQQHSHDDTSLLSDLLDKLPSGMFGGDDEKQKMNDIQSNAQAAQMNGASISPREPEEFTRYIQQVYEQIMPAIEFHDSIMKSITKTIENIPILPQIIEQIEDQLSMWVFTIIAPFVVPIIDQVKNELGTGSQEIIASSENEQHVVFNDDDCSDPTHSMLAKDHFSNILNEIAGRTASKVVAWVVPQLMEAWDDESVDVDRLMDRIISGVLHHPAQRDMGEDGAQECRELMFRSVEEWWNNMGGDAQDEYRQKLSREGILQGDNHKEGVVDCGHGCGQPLSMHKNYGGSVQDRIAGAAAGAILDGVTGSISNIIETQTGGQIRLPTTSGGDSSFSGNLLSQIGGSLLQSSFGGGDDQGSYESRQQRDDGSYTEHSTTYERSDDRYEETTRESRYSGGDERTDYNRYEQDDGERSYSRHERTETRPSYGDDYEERTEYSRYERDDSARDDGARDDGARDDSARDYSYQERTETRTSYGGDYEERSEHRHERSCDRSGSESSCSNQRRSESRGGRGDEYSRRDETSGYGRSDYGRSGDDGGEDRHDYGRSDDYSREERREYSRQTDDYGGEERQEYSYGSSGNSGRERREHEYSDEYDVVESHDYKRHYGRSEEYGSDREDSDEYRRY